MESLSVKTFTTSRSLTYRYHISSENQTNIPALLLLHGFRDTALCWKFMVSRLATLPYRLVIPDLLGHGGTSKPTDTASYANHLMTKDMIELLDSEHIETVIPVGHDHGSFFAQRIYNYFPSRMAALILLNVAYRPPSDEPFNLVTINEMSKAAFGYPVFEYWNFLTGPDAAGLMNANLDRVWEIPHANTFAEMQRLYGVPNAYREYLAGRSERVNVKPYARDEKLKAEWKAELEKGGLEGPLCWYTAHVQQVHWEKDRTIPDESKTVRVPTLFIGCDGDAPCRLELINVAKDAGLLPDLTVHTLQGVGHWPMYESPDHTANLVVAFLEEKLSI